MPILSAENNESFRKCKGTIQKLKWFSDCRTIKATEN